ncbi:MAG: IS200/IS605 family transposase [Verrucomicrobiales bacterium]
MPSTYTSLHYHIIFSTKNREDCLAAEWRASLHEYLGGCARGLGAQPEGVGGVGDHVHLLLSLRATHCLSDFMRELKKASSVWIGESFKSPRFHWQEGYAAFSVSPSALEKVRRYIANQESHHRTVSCREELISFLRKSVSPSR